MSEHKRTASRRKRNVRIAAAVVTAAAAVVAATSAQAIVGGTPTTSDKNPFLVAIQLVGGWCTGTLISPTEVLTTAQCLVSNPENGPSTTRVIAGRTNVFDKDGNKNKVVGVEVGPGQGYDGVPTNDIAVLVLKHPISSKYKPIKWVSSGFTYKPGTQARIIGWGATDPNKDETQGDLREASLPIRPETACSSVYGNDYNPENMVCAGREEGGVDACYEDAAAPLLVKEGDEERVAGLISWGGECAAAGEPGVYTKVSKFADWLATLQ